MELTENQLKHFDHIASDEVIQDIEDTERELKNYKDELDVLMRNPTENKARIYMIEGHILKHKELLNTLYQIKKYREL